MMTTEEQKPKKPTITLPPVKKNNQFNQPKMPKPNSKGFGGASVVRRTGRGR
jgi:hypothetical protein